LVSHDSLHVFSPGGHDVRRIFGDLEPSVSVIKKLLGARDGSLPICAKVCICHKKNLPEGCRHSNQYKLTEKTADAQDHGQEVYISDIRG